MTKTIDVGNSAHLTRPKYRADIDGLRAVAVLSVYWVSRLSLQDNWRFRWCRYFLRHFWLFNLINYF